MGDRWGVGGEELGNMVNERLFCATGVAEEYMREEIKKKMREQGWWPFCLAAIIFGFLFICATILGFWRVLMNRMEADPRAKKVTTNTRTKHTH